MRPNSELVTEEIFSRKSETPGDPGSFRGWPAYSRSLARTGLYCSSQPSQPNRGSNSESQAKRLGKPRKSRLGQLIDETAFHFASCGRCQMRWPSLYTSRTR